MSWAEFRVSVRGGSNPRELRSRLAACALGLLVVFSLLVGRLWVLQVVHGEEFAELAQENTLKEREIPAPRGAIYDAHGHRIAEVHASFDLVISPQDVLSREEALRPARADVGALGGPTRLYASDDGDALSLPPKVDVVTLARRLAPLLDDANPEELAERVTNAESPWRSVVLKEDLSPDELTRVMARRPWLPGVRVVSRHRRFYPDGEVFSHLIGYLREVRPDELQTLRTRYEGSPQGRNWYGSGDLIGKYGVESAFEPYLRGHVGKYWVQVDVHGRELGRSSGAEQPGDDYFRSIAHFLDRGLQPELSGHDLHLTIRRDLQSKAIELLGEEIGGFQPPPGYDL